MSRGRKAKSNSSNLGWQQVFSKNVGKYLQYAIIESSKVDNPSTETGLDLLKRIKEEKGKNKKEKALPPIKASEIPYEIPRNWVWCRLGEICNYTSNERAEPSKLTPDTWVLDLEDIEKETSKLLCKIRFSERNSLSTKSVFEKGDVLYSKLRPYLDKVIVADENGVCTTEILPLQVYGNINPYYLRYALKRNDFLDYVNSVTKGMKMPRLGTREGQLALIPLPPLSEQTQIVDFLTDFENENLKEDGYYFNQEVEQKVIALHEAQLKGVELSNELTHQLTLVKSLRQQLLQDAVQGKLVAQNPDDEPATVLLEKIKVEKEKLIAEKKIKKEKPLPPIKPEEIPFEIPGNWIWCRLGEIANFVSGNNFKSEDFKNGDGVKCIKITNAGVGKVVETDDVLPLNFKEIYKSYLVYENDLILALTRPYITDGLKISKCPKSYNGSLLNQRVAVIRCSKYVDNNFVYAIMSSDYVLNIYKSLFGSKGQQPNLRKEDVIELLLPLPPLSEQTRIVQKLEELMRYCDGLEAGIKESMGQNERLLQQVLREALRG